MIVTILLVALILGIALGPRAKVVLFWRPEISRIQLTKHADEITTADLKALRDQITEQESNYSGLEPDAAKHIEFSAESRPKRTRYCVLYIHGFSACRQEISPVPENIAKQLHANYYGTRLTGHGLDGPALAEATPSDWIFDATEAWKVAETLGEKVIIIATSTGGTLATWLAQQPAVIPKLAACINVSPNYQPKHWSMPLFLMPWARYWMPLLSGPDYGWEPSNELGARYWTYRYPTSVFYGMAALVRAVRHSDVEHIEAPTLFIYSDDDQVVNSRYTDRIARRWGSAIKHRIAVPPRPGHNNHVVTGDAVVPERTADTTKDIMTFLKRYVLTD